MFLPTITICRDCDDSSMLVAGIRTVQRYPLNQFLAIGEQTGIVSTYCESSIRDNVPALPILARGSQLLGVG